MVLIWLTLITLILVFIGVIVSIFTIRTNWDNKTSREYAMIALYISAFLIFVAILMFAVMIWTTSHTHTHIVNDPNSNTSTVITEKTDGTTF